MICDCWTSASIAEGTARFCLYLLAIPRWLLGTDALSLERVGRQRDAAGKFLSTAPSQLADEAENLASTGEIPATTPPCLQQQDNGSS